MSAIVIKTVQSKKDLKDFIKLQWKIYKDDPYWVPPLFIERMEMLDKKKNPFFQHAEAEYFLAYKNNELVGRIAAIKNDLHNKVHNENIGFFGFFESIDDEEVAAELFKAAEKWAREKNLDALRGPANPSSNDDWGLLIEGFKDSPRVMMTYNPEYYLKLLEKSGYSKAKDLYAYKLSNDEVSKIDRFVRGAKLVAERYNVKVRTLNLKKLNEEVEKIKEVYNQAWAPNWGFVPLTEAEIDKMAKDLKMLVDPDLVLFLEIDNKTIGFSLVMPDIFAILKEMNGRLFPFGWIKFFTAKKNIKWVRIITLGIIPEYQKKGIDNIFYHEIVNRAVKKGYLLGEASWILEDNEMMKRGIESLGGYVYKKYRIYEKKLK